MTRCAANPRASRHAGGDEQKIAAGLKAHAGYLAAKRSQRGVGERRGRTAQTVTAPPPPGDGCAGAVESDTFTGSSVARPRAARMPACEKTRSAPLVADGELSSVHRSRDRWGVGLGQRHRCARRGVEELRAKDNAGRSGAAALG